MDQFFTLELYICTMVSVCMATYNGERFIEKQLKSILVQLREEDELIISDDSSCDNTVAIIKSFEDKRIRLYTNQKFRDPLMNFSFVLSKAQNDIIFLCDQDDLWSEHKVESMVSALKDADLAVCNHSVINVNDEVEIPSYYALFPSRAKKGFIRSLLKNPYIGCCMAFRKTVLNKAMPIPQKVKWHDWWIGLVAELYFNVTFIDTPYTLYRKHEANVTFGSSLKSGNSFSQKLIYRWNILRQLPRLLFR